VQVNEGNVILYNILPSTDKVLTSSIACTPANGILAVAATMTCTATYTFDHSTFEAGAWVITASLASANLTTASSSNAVTVTPVEAPSVQIAINLTSCVAPTDAGRQQGPGLCC
jgi:hypothetical protein